MPSKITILEGDNIDILPTLENACVDAVITDPPYNLGFMGKGWDKDTIAFYPEFWEEVMRTMKPGAYLLAFGGSRTFHRMTCAIEDAGFEIRDTIMWLYGSGFPKSLNVHKAVWKEILLCQSNVNAPLAVQISESTYLSCGADTENIAVAPALILPEGRPALLTEIGREDGLRAVTVTLLSESEAENINLSIGWSWSESKADRSLLTNTFTTETKSKTQTNQEIWQLCRRASTHRYIIPDATIADGRKWSAAIVEKHLTGESANLSAIPTLTALGCATWNPVKRVDGFGSALKPAFEPIIVARKPLIGTVVQNVLRHGTGALNIDACRVPLAADDKLQDGIQRGDRLGRAIDTRNADGSWGFKEVDRAAGLGRHPANVLHDGSDEVEAAFAAFGERTSGARKAGSYGLLGSDRVFGDAPAAPMPELTGGGGGASRFFYSAKATAEDRFDSKHPTVKPIMLMQWLCKLVTPPGGTILDCFAGTGSTLLAAKALNFNAIGIEKEHEYVLDIQNKLKQRGFLF